LGQTFTDEHDLSKLLVACAQHAPDTDLFVLSFQAQTIIDRYDPVYEFPHAPVQYKIRPKNGSYINLQPLDICVLDYFIYRIKEVFPNFTDKRDIERNINFSLMLCKKIQIFSPNL
jgi:hypothetical protein